ncbi:hypothetical protein [Salana multivorans]
MSVSRLRGLIYAQDGVVSREQLVATGLAVGFGQDRVRSGRWQRLAVGVYLTNSGIVTFTHRCWAAVLHAGAGAAITGDAAAYLDHSVDRPPRRIDVVVPHGRRVRAPGPDVVVTRTRIPYTIEERPPRTSAVTTALHRLRSADTATDVIAILTGAARALGSAGPLRAEVARRTHVPWRGIVTAILAPENEGHESVLEWNFTTKVLTAHGLPVPRRQKRERLGQNQIRIDGISEEWGVRFASWTVASTRARRTTTSGVTTRQRCPTVSRLCGSGGFTSLAGPARQRARWSVGTARGAGVATDADAVPPARWAWATSGPTRGTSTGTAPAKVPQHGAAVGWES